MENKYEVFSQHLSKLRIPGAHDKVYKDECVYSFDTPEIETGLYVNLTTFLGFGKDFVDFYYKKTGNAVFLHIKKTKYEIESPQQGDGPEKKITRLAIGVEGGFNPESGAVKYEVIENYSVVVLPDFVTFNWPDSNLPKAVSESVRGVLESQSATKVAELEALAGSWDGEARLVSKHADSLVQLDNGIKIPPSGWKCEKCDLTENLWLNLTDGSILCGRKFYDGTGGNDHAVEHYKQSGYPLAVKLGTITKEGKADVFSYDEDDMVEDPNLSKHLAHFGINITQMEKTEKSMLELELDLNQKVGEWAALQESGGVLKPLYGPGYTGMANLGNSCYVNSVMQVIFIIPDFVKRFVDKVPEIFYSNYTDPANDFNVQVAKLGSGLLSGKYSIPPPAGSPVDADSPGISPHMFKTLVGKGHVDFSSKKQQDAQEYFLHFLDLVNRHSRHQSLNPADAFKFCLEERYQCGVSKGVKYLQRSDWLLHLPIPLQAATNKEAVAAYEAKKAELEASDPEQIVRPRIKLFSCLEAFTQSEIVEQFYSTAVNEKTTARKTTRLASFPDYLMIHAKKFMLREDWVPIKLDVALEVPDILDASSLRGTGLQPDEFLLPQTNNPPPEPTYDENILSQLVEMGFPAESCKRALFFTHNNGLEAATNWIMEHIADADFSDPFVPPGTDNASGSGNFVPDENGVELLCGMGFTRPQATKALKATDNNIERAADWIFSHQDELDSIDDSNTPPEAQYRDGNEKYRLVAFISHMGTSTMVGHYVCHILRDNQWVIYNDNKVAVSENPPKELGYLYLYERIAK
ncbi:ubiquitin carboxyl-terminal hydrolase 5 isoform X3 [Chrysoperla carnea]|uniref:ubiquitin carboxyl-terminal hydrolase 5 isoform X3 n=1 Tax=Chrysoperla carnea TaxID=189513 RepID=UPI001D06FDDF|nr:ubiquitin carboxyl-terminal hydrolase 5 isoform X3 [Chrysoperla carnea]